MCNNIDCNNCEYINLTELDQKDKTEFHICKLFNKRVLHRANSVAHNSLLYPHNQCSGEYFEWKDTNNE